MCLIRVKCPEIRADASTPSPKPSRGSAVMPALSSSWTATPEGRGGDVFDPLFAALGRLPFDGLALCGEVGPRALEDAAPVLERRELRLVAFRGPVGSPLRPLAEGGVTPWLASPDPAL